MYTYPNLVYCSGSDLWVFSALISSQNHVFYGTFNPSSAALSALVNHVYMGIAHVCKCWPLLIGTSKCFNSQNKLFFWRETILFIG